MRGLPPLRWAVIVADLEPVVGHEQGGARRCLVVSYEPFHRSGQVTICPITAARSRGRYPGEIPIPVGEAGQTRAGVILCHQVRTVSLRRIQGGITADRGRIRYVVAPDIRRGVRRAIQEHFGLDVPPDYDGAG